MAPRKKRTTAKTKRPRDRQAPAAGKAAPVAGKTGGKRPAGRQDGKGKKRRSPAGAARTASPAPERRAKPASASRRAAAKEKSGGAEGSTARGGRPAERARLEERLRNSETRLRSLLDSVPDLVLELDRHGIIRYANRPPPGVGPALREATDVAALVLPEERTAVREALALAWDSGRPVDIETRAPDDQGRVMWWWARIAPVVRDGRTERLLVATREITRRKIAERTLRSAEHRLQDLLDPLNLLAVVVRGDGRIAYCNDHFLVRTGWRRHELIGQPFLERCVPADSRGFVAPILERAVRTASIPAHYEHAIVTRDGSRRLVAWSHTVLRGAEGRFAALASLGEDITDRQVTETALRESEEKFRALFSASVDAIALYDTETMHILDANEAFERMYGYARGELGALTAVDLSDEPEETRALFEGLREPGRQLTVRRRSRRKDGSLFLADISDGVFQLRGRPVVWAIIRDVTERVRAEEQLRTAHERHEATLEALPDLLFVMDGERRITEFRAPHEEFLYTAPERFLGRRMREVLPGEAGEVIDRAIDDAEREGVHYGSVYALDLPGGRRWFEISISRRGPHGSPPMGYVALARDVTLQHVAEDALRASEAMNRLLVEGAGAAIGFFDPSGTVLYVNAIAAALAGGAPGDFVGRTLREVSGPLDVAVIESRLEAVVRSGEPGEFEDRIRLPQGTKWFLSKWQPLRDREDRLTGVQLIALDITARREAEERERGLADKLQQTQKLESLGVLAGGIAHDFNNLLSGILGNADLALLELPPGSAARHPLEQVLSGARRAADLTRQMLAYSGRGRFVVETIRLPELVREMGSLLEVSISKRNVLRYEFAESVPAVEVDVAQLRQVVMNLILNAGEAIGDASGVIAVRIGATHAEARDLAEYILGETLTPGTFVYIEVADTGAGMTPEVQSRIFEPFYSTKFAGRGLGLAAVLGIVRGHRGALRIVSQAGHGTTFRILLPASGGSVAAEAGRPAAEPGWRATGTVLVVDDEETVLATSRRMLERMGFSVLAAGGGRRALHLLEGQGAAIRAVLLDLTMPDMDGVQVCGEIRRRWPRVPVVISSGYSEHEVMPRFADQSGVDFVQKPFGYDTLTQVMRKALEPEGSTGPAAPGGDAAAV